MSRGADFEDLAGRAAAARRNNQISEAFSLYRQALQLKPEWAEGWWFAGTLSYSLFQFADCEKAFTNFVQIDDTRPIAWSLLGLCEFETGQYTQSQTHLERGLASNSELAPELEASVRFHRAMLLTKAGQFDRGHRALSRLAAAAESEPVLMTAIGLNALRMPLLPKEVPSDRRDLVTKAGNVASFWMQHPKSFAAVIAASTFGDDVSAWETFHRLESEFQDLLASYPKAPGVHYLYATYLSESRPSEAQVEFRRELEINPRNHAALAMVVLGQLEHETGDAVLTSLRQALSEDGVDPLVEFAYGKVIASGSLAEGIEHLQTAVRLDPATLAYHTALASAYSKAGRYQDTFQEREAAIAIAEGHGAADF
jgi:tetratricopeptide (TPR) repeat protein